MLGPAANVINTMTGTNRINMRKEVKYKIKHTKATEQRLFKQLKAVLRIIPEFIQGDDPWL